MILMSRLLSSLAVGILIKGIMGVMRCLVDPQEQVEWRLAKHTFRTSQFTQAFSSLSSDPVERCSMHMHSVS